MVASGKTGGEERYVASLCRKFNSFTDNYQLRVCFSMGGGEVADRIEREGTKVFLLGLHSGYDLLRAFKLRSIIKQERIDIIHSHGPLPISNLIARFSGVPVQVMTDHGPTLGSQVKRKWRRTLFLRLFRNLIDGYIAISRNILDTLKAREMISEEKISLIYNGVDVDALRGAARTPAGGPFPGLPFDAEAPVIGTVSRLVTDKRLHLFLEACSKIARKNDRIRFIIAGEGPLRGDLEKRSLELGLKDKVFFLGRRDDVPDLLSAMDIYLCTSMGEAFSLALLEAMALSRPIVAFDVEGVCEAVFHGETGLLIENGDVDGMTNACLSLLEDENKRKKMCEAALLKVRERFSLEKNIRSLDRLYRDLLARKKKH